MLQWHHLLGGLLRLKRHYQSAFMHFVGGGRSKIYKEGEKEAAAAAASQEKV